MKANALFIAESVFINLIALAISAFGVYVLIAMQMPWFVTWPMIVIFVLACGFVFYLSVIQKKIMESKFY